MGFIENPTHHIKLQYISLSGEPTHAKTFLSHGSKDYGDKLLYEISKQLYLNKKELLRLIDGKMPREEYEHILRVKGIIE
jgi:hypothetical protein